MSKTYRDKINPNSLWRDQKYRKQLRLEIEESRKETKKEQKEYFRRRKTWKKIKKWHETPDTQEE